MAGGSWASALRRECLPGHPGESGGGSGCARGGDHHQSRPLVYSVGDSLYIGCLGG